MDIELTHHFEIDVKGFQLIADDAAVIDEQMKRMKHMKERRVIAFREEDGMRHRTVQFVMHQKIPGSGHLIIIEESVFNIENNEFSFTASPGSFGKMVKTEGVYKVFEEGPNKTRRDITMTVKVMIPGAEKLLGKMMTDSLEKNMDAETLVIQDAIKGEIPLGPGVFVPPVVVEPYEKPSKKSQGS